ncbi:MAG: hypothetical protein ACI8RZ_002171 [Myxococcota bacterium]|jgi:hypothetical protein
MNPFLLIASALAGDDTHSVDAYIGTDFPIMVGAGATYEHPTRLRLDVNGGFMPGPYVDAINWGLTTFDIYSDTVADIIDAVLKNALVGRVELGYRPFPTRGWTVSAGYQHLRVFGNTADLTDFADGVDEDALAQVQEFTGDLLIDVAVHQVTGEIGYERALFPKKFDEHLRIRGTFGFSYTLKANTVADTTNDPTNPPQEEATAIVLQEAEAYLDDIFEDYVHIPMVGLAAGYRF